jgi:hypothetical protein
MGSGDTADEGAPATAPGASTGGNAGGVSGGGHYSLPQIVQSLATSGGASGPSLAALAQIFLSGLEPGFTPVGLPAGLQILGFGPTTENVGADLAPY